MHGFELALPEVLTSLDCILEIFRAPRALQTVRVSFRYQTAFGDQRDRGVLQTAGQVGNKMLFDHELRDLSLVGLAVDFCQQQIRGAHIVRSTRSHGKAPWDWHAMLSAKVFDGIFVASQQALDEE